MSEINLNESNETIIHKYFQGLVCDEFSISIFSGGQSTADEKLNNIDNLSKK